VAATFGERRIAMARIAYSVLAILMLVFSATTSVFAQKTEVLRGAGSASCGAYVQAYDDYRPFANANSVGLGASAAIGNYAQYEAWIQGYLFGVDSWNKRQIKKFDRAGMQLWFYNYCQQHPLTQIVNAALAFYRELGGPVPTGGDVSN
jgi:hypothetical protein